MKRRGGMFRLGDEVPQDYFSEAELADLLKRGKVEIEAQKSQAIHVDAPKLEPKPESKPEPKPEPKKTEELDLELDEKPKKRSSRKGKKS